MISTNRWRRIRGRLQFRRFDAQFGGILKEIMKDEIASMKEPKGKETERRNSTNGHPSRSLEPRAKGYGIGGGYERPYHRGSATNTRNMLQPADGPSESYGPVPHSGYYGAGAGAERFERGQAGFKNELSWYGPQYGESTSGRSKEQP